SVALGLGLPEDYWPRIRRDLVQELESRQHEYRWMFGTKDYNNIYNTVNIAGLWMVMPDTGLVIASKYNKVVVSLSNDRGCATSFPLWSSPTQSDSHEIIVIAHVNGNHYIRVDLREGFPLPVTHPRWNTYKRIMHLDGETDMLVVKILFASIIIVILKHINPAQETQYERLQERSNISYDEMRVEHQVFERHTHALRNFLVDVMNPDNLLPLAYSFKGKEWCRLEASKGANWYLQTHVISHIKSSFKFSILVNGITLKKFIRKGISLVLKPKVCLSGPAKKKSIVLDIVNKCKHATNMLRLLLTAPGCNRVATDETKIQYVGSIVIDLQVENRRANDVSSFKAIDTHYFDLMRRGERMRFEVS
ncbi:hypothetical protein Tco_0736149, partial [Tanacetum coccineum]